LYSIGNTNTMGYLKAPTVVVIWEDATHTHAQYPTKCTINIRSMLPWPAAAIVGHECSCSAEQRFPDPCSHHALRTIHVQRYETRSPTPRQRPFNAPCDSTSSATSRVAFQNYFLRIASYKLMSPAIPAPVTMPA
jgi:hypothetical protein